MQYQKSARVTLWAVRLFLVCLVGLLFGTPALIRWYAGLRRMPAELGRAISIAFYVCAPAAGAALLAMHRLLRRIMAGQVFTLHNVRLVRLVSLCCAWVALACLSCGFVYPPLLFVFIMMAFLCLMVLVVSHVLGAATALREENDLTI